MFVLLQIRKLEVIFDAPEEHYQEIDHYHFLHYNHELVGGDTELKQLDAPVEYYPLAHANDDVNKCAQDEKYDTIGDDVNKIDSRTRWSTPVVREATIVKTMRVKSDGLVSSNFDALTRDIEYVTPVHVEYKINFTLPEKSGTNQVLVTKKQEGNVYDNLNKTDKTTEHSDPRVPLKLKTQNHQERNVQDNLEDNVGRQSCKTTLEDNLGRQP
uniref:Uncharacterized protein n=1 Tax=Biomphalaria glabrata TaxID=6526 RepID=A0A2C9JKV0_BIOGL